MRYFLLLVFLPSLVWAEPQLKRIESLIATGDIAVLSEGLAEARTEAEAEGPEVLRLFWRDFERAFYVTHPDRQALARRWVDEEPESSLALTALGLLHMKRGFTRRGAFSNTETPPSARAAFHADATKAADLAERALAQDRRAISAYMILFSVGMARQIENEAYDRAEDLIDVHPSTWSVNRVVSAYDPSWGWPYDAIVAVCERYAPRVPGYDAKTCLDIAHLKFFGDSPAAQASRERLWSRTEPWLEDIKFRDFYRRGGLDPLDQPTIDWAFSHHRTMIDDTNDPVGWWMQGVQLSVRYNSPLYAAEARERAAPKIAAVEARDPFDHDRLSVQAEVEKIAGQLWNQPVSRERLAELWARSMVYGRENQWRWLEGLAFQPDWTNADAMMPFINNAIVAAPDKVTIYRAAFERMDNVAQILESAAQRSGRTTISGVDLATVPDRLDRLNCLRVRVARLLKAECSSPRRLLDDDCSRGNPYHATVLAFLSEAAGPADICPEVRNAPLASLAFTERMPFKPLDDLLAQHPDQLD